MKRIALFTVAFCVALSTTAHASDARTDCALVVAKSKRALALDKRQSDLRAKANWAFHVKYTDPAILSMTPQERDKKWRAMKETKLFLRALDKEQKADDAYLKAMMRLYKNQLGYTQSEVQNFYDWSYGKRKAKAHLENGGAYSDLEARSFPKQEGREFCRSLGIDNYF